MKRILQNRLAKYLLLTFAITWSFWVTDAVLVKATALKASDIVPMILFTLGGFGPTVAACFCLPGGFSWKKLGAFLKAHKKKRLWFLGLFPALVIVFFALNATGLIPTLPQSPAAILVTALITFLTAAVLYGGNEEWGWRGTMHPILAERLPAWIVPAIVGVVWVCWHIPLWFIEGDSHQSMSFLSFAILGMALSYWLSAVYDMTGSVLCCMALHGLVNTLMGLLTIKSNSVFYWIGLAVLTAAAVCFSIYAHRKSAKSQ